MLLGKDGAQGRLTVNVDYSERTEAMDPISTIGALLTAVKKASENAKRLNNAEMQSILLDAQEQVLALKDELLDLRTENASLKQELLDRKSLTFDGGAYWHETGSSRDGPFCSRCFDADGVRVHMHATRRRYFHCSNCDQNFNVPSAPDKPDDPPLHRQRIVRG